MSMIFIDIDETLMEPPTATANSSMRTNSVDEGIDVVIPNVVFTGATNNSSCNAIDALANTVNVFRVGLICPVHTMPALSIISRMHLRFTMATCIRCVNNGYSVQRK